MNIVRPGVSEGNQDMAGINYISPSNNNLNILKRKILKYLTWNLFFNLHIFMLGFLLLSIYIQAQLMFDNNT